MMKKSFFNRQSTAITALLHGASVDELIARARTSEFEGADCIAIELGLLPPEQRTIDSFRTIMAAVKLPFMFILYRNDRWHQGDDQARQEYLLRAAEAGAEVIDVMGDLFDPAPFELTFNPEAIVKQKKLIEQIHQRNAKVIISSHMSMARTSDEVLKHLREQSSRGADMLKIVTGVHTEDDFLEAIRTTLRLNRELDKPFVHLSNGPYSRMHRFMGPKLGVAVTFAVESYRHESPMSQPTIRSFRAVSENLAWHVNDCVGNHSQ